MFDLKGRTVLITGGARGLGRHITLAAAAAGAQVAFTYLNSVVAADALSLELTKLSVKYEALKCDVRSQNSVSLTVEKVLDTFGQIDVLINNAGFQIPGDSEEITVDSFDRVLATNLRGAFMSAQLAIRHFLG